MPFDGHEPLAKLAPPYAFGNDKLAELEWLLRRGVDRVGWRWNFPTIRGRCGTSGCAIGFAMMVGLTESLQAGCDDFNMDHYNYRSIFCTGGAVEVYGVGPRRVTPLMVADAIRRYMTTGEV